MGKKADQARKRRRLAESHDSLKPIKASKLDTASTVLPEFEGDSLISDEDLLITIETLNALAEDPSELADRRMKDLKRSLYGLHRVLGEGAALGEHQNLPYSPHACPISSFGHTRICLADTQVHLSLRRYPPHSEITDSKTPLYCYTKCLSVNFLPSSARYNAGFGNATQPLPSSTKPIPTQ